uniref:Uncharacterized protein n=1 Tax=Knipowitschia caucasica TaxID=637954 RepID=A0AAV2L2X2_KNICA
MKMRKEEEDWEEGREGDIIPAWKRFLSVARRKCPWTTSVLWMFANKMQELETQLSHKSSALSEVKEKLKESKQREEEEQRLVRRLEEQVELLKSLPSGAKTDSGLMKEFQALRLINSELQQELSDLKRQITDDKTETGKSTKDELRRLTSQLQSSESERSRLQKELRRFDETFFEELEDLKYNYNTELKRNILLEEQLRGLCERYGEELPNVSTS